MLILKKPFSKDPKPCSQSPSGKFRFSQKQTSDSYAMKQPENFAEAVSSASKITAEKILSKEKEKFEVYPLNTFPILAIDKESENFPSRKLKRKPLSCTILV